MENVRVEIIQITQRSRFVGKKIVKKLLLNLSFAVEKCCITIYKR